MLNLYYVCVRAICKGWYWEDLDKWHLFSLLLTVPATCVCISRTTLRICDPSVY